MAAASVTVRPFTWVYRWDTTCKSYTWIRRPVSTPVIDIDDVIDNNYKSLYDEYAIRNLRKNNVFTRPVILSNELCKFLNIPPESMMARAAVTRHICNYAKDHGLLKGQDIHLDERLIKLFPNLNEKLNILGLQSCLKPHYPYSDDQGMQSKFRTILKNKEIKQEMMELLWHPDRIQHLIAKNPGMHWNHEEKAYTELDFNSMADIL